MTILSNLRSEPWSQLQHAFGNAEEVPFWILGLLDSNVARREESLAELFNSIWNQGTVYQATGYAIPYLLEILRSPDCPDRSSVAQLLAVIATGRGYYQVHAALPDSRAREILQKQGSTLEATLEQEANDVERVRLESRRALADLWPFLSDGDPEVRACVAEALAMYPNLKETHLPLLRTALAAETDEDARERIGESVARLESAE